MVSDLIVISDLDGTLVLTDPAVQAASMEVLGRPLTRDQTRDLPHHIESKIHDLYQTKYSNLIVANQNFLPLYLNYVRQGVPTIILTARSHLIKQVTKALLQRLGIPYTHLIMRHARVADEEYKAAKLEKLVSMHPNKTFVYYDDRLENISYVANKLKERNIILFYHVGPRNIRRAFSYDI